MDSTTTNNLKEELEQFRMEREKIRGIISSIGGAKNASWDATVTKMFTIVIVILFILDIVRYVLHISIHLPPLISIHLGVLLVSLKIIWMVHKQGKVEHFQFWILNSIEFRLNDIAQLIKKIEEQGKNH